MLLSKLTRLYGGDLRLDFGTLEKLRRLNNKGIEHETLHGEFRISFFGSGWRIIKNNVLYIGQANYFEDDDDLSKKIQSELENVISIQNIERVNQYDYKLFFDQKIIIETFLLESGASKNCLFITDRLGKEINNIDLFCKYYDKVLKIN